MRDDISTQPKRQSMLAIAKLLAAGAKRDTAMLVCTTADGVPVYHKVWVDRSKYKKPRQSSRELARRRTQRGSR